MRKLFIRVFIREEENMLYLLVRDNFYHFSKNIRKNILIDERFSILREEAINNGFSIIIILLQYLLNYSLNYKNICDLNEIICNHMPFFRNLKDFLHILNVYSSSIRNTQKLDCPLEYFVVAHSSLIDKNFRKCNSRNKLSLQRFNKYGHNLNKKKIL